MWEREQLCLMTVREICGPAGERWFRIMDNLSPYIQRKQKGVINCSTSTDRFPFAFPTVLFAERAKHTHTHLQLPLLIPPLPRCPGMPLHDTYKVEPSSTHTHLVLTMFSLALAPPPACTMKTHTHVPPLESPGTLLLQPHNRTHTCTLTHIPAPTNPTFRSAKSPSIEKRLSVTTSLRTPGGLAARRDCGHDKEERRGEREG